MPSFMPPVRAVLLESGSVIVEWQAGGALMEVELSNLGVEWLIHDGDDITQGTLEVVVAREDES